jgi:hypothetical protein
MKVHQTGKQLTASFFLFVLSIHGSQAQDFDALPEQTDLNSSMNLRPGFHAVERLGFTVGGNTISRFARADGTIREISAGGLYQAGLGVLYQWDVMPFSAALTINYHVDSDYNNNNNASFRRNPLEVLAYFNGLLPFRFGGGVRYVYAARADSTFNGVTEKIRFENTRGSIVEIGYQVTSYGWVNLRYVKEKYFVRSYASLGGTASGLSGTAPYDGSHFGLLISCEY